MTAAGKTHGGFYRHFDSKEALLAAAVESAFADMQADAASGLAQAPPGETLARFLGHYLAADRVVDRGNGCPVAALSGDVGRGTDALHQLFGTGIRRIVAVIADSLEGPPDDRQSRAVQAFAMAAGAMMIARASDPETSAMVLAAVRPDESVSAV
jgi:TetR/AcrR family transcriptional repressor of nem operon